MTRARAIELVEEMLWRREREWADAVFGESHKAIRKDNSGPMLERVEALRLALSALLTDMQEGE